MKKPGKIIKKMTRMLLVKAYEKAKTGYSTFAKEKPIISPYDMFCILILIGIMFGYNIK